LDAQSGHLVEAYVDGACIPRNPSGIPVWGFLLLRDHTPLETRGGLAGAESSPKATNNVAEYEAFINALKQIKRLGWDQDKIVVYTDSRIVRNQLKDEWKAKPALLPWYKKAKALMNGFSYFELRWIPGNQNRVADRAAKVAYYEARLAQLKKK